MSQDKYVYLALEWTEDWFYIKVSEIEYKDMLRALRMWDNAQNYWIQDVMGDLYNINKFCRIYITRHEPAIKLMDEKHEEYLKVQGLI